ncbi:MAG: peptidase M23 [Sulfurimonas sp. RIFOXYD12_FULL_33_39]|uniref:M23 family metallopeptidase n=1 Tax=unclassified Sulfurimonas TaxID=2623549 RepID=UPI0008D3DFA2|nr:MULTISPECIES: M23 family metallopeptidase [unclassified Sulfurimonas]OHE07524.1 MAG: peptidase M23 [Sulfurimonas sp. RIFCSPLOWO2_12_FULL_34_6]OHE08687.1 MAG: peptidase M23 [Sulfurimonas sp. RIFOXYD12_FULL_33_39]OHE13972.1 MAG: peptidase M23 [Sulfurimonas sp. RIFOXYD2_FULL_34_21]DAB27617.1 MAG TPA: peptidase M23 [Sulfurimonas sp. UBA10385]
MNNHFTITINDDNGVRQFNLHQIMKKAILYVIFFGGAVTLIAVGTILYLNYAVDAIEQKRQTMQKAYMLQKEKNQALDDSIKQTHLSLIEKKKKLDEVSQTLSEIETLIGLAPQEEMTLEQRADITKLNSEHMATLMQFIPSGSPVEYNGVTSGFGYRIHPTLNTNEFHAGVDLKASMNTSVYATADGIVEWSGLHQKSGYGNLIILQHNYGFRSYFGHLNKILVESGKFVKKGDLIAYTGNTGMSSGPHLHYEIRFVQRAVDSLGFVQWSVKNYKDIFKKEKQIPWQSLINATAHIKVPQPTQTLPSSQLALQSQER